MPRDSRAIMQEGARLTMEAQLHAEQLRRLSGELRDLATEIQNQGTAVMHEQDRQYYMRAMLAVSDAAADAFFLFNKQAIETMPKCVNHDNGCECEARRQKALKSLGVFEFNKDLS